MLIYKTDLNAVFVKAVIIYQTIISAKSVRVIKIVIIVMIFAVIYVRKAIIWTVSINVF